MLSYQEISLASISPSPQNPRKTIDPRKLDELAASIKQKGVIEPIIVRPVAAAKGRPGHYEIVAGERRFRAAGQAGLSAIPAIVRELTDDESYDFMLVENLQRDDLTEREEAESFKAYIARHGEEAIVSLAEKTGITPAYIRGRARVLELPAKVLKAWEEGKLAFGHLQQLLRVSRARKEKLEETVKWLLTSRWNGSFSTIKELAEYIDRDAPSLLSALFKTADLCKACSANSTVQRNLFGIDAKGAHCLNPACFKKHQAQFLVEHWKETATAKKCGTNGFRFLEDAGYDLPDFGWRGQPGKKCQGCENLVTIINLAGEIQREKACAGERSCFNAVTNPKSAKEKATGEKDPGAPRASWHGEAFMNKFLKRQIRERLKKATKEQVQKLAVFCLAHENHAAFAAAGDEFGDRLMTSAGTGSDAMLSKIFALPPASVDLLARKMLTAIADQGNDDGQIRSYEITLGTRRRKMVADYLGIDLAKEYAVDEEYLARKTRAEILAFIKKFKLFPVGNVAKMKKKDLDKAVLALGPKLVGKVPDEILKERAR